MTNINGAERERRLNESLSRQGERPSTHIVPLERFGHFFRHIITPISLDLERGETVSGLDIERQQFLEDISQIEFSPQERARIQPIIDLAQSDWTPEVIEQLVKIEKKAFPGLSKQARQKIREQETKRRR